MGYSLENMGKQRKRQKRVKRSYRNKQRRKTRRVKKSKKYKKKPQRGGMSARNKQVITQALSSAVRNLRDTRKHQHLRKVMSGIVGKPKKKNFMEMIFPM